MGRWVWERQKDRQCWALKFLEQLQVLLFLAGSIWGGLLQGLEFPELGDRISRIIPTVKELVHVNFIQQAREQLIFLVRPTTSSHYRKGEERQGYHPKGTLVSLGRHL